MTDAPDPSKLRTGYTTGACAAAAAKAAARVLVRGEMLREIETTLPNGTRVTFPLARCERTGNAVVASVIKDAGDDPDCTHGAELVAEVQLTASPGVELLGGEGVATVTKPGLGLVVGSPAINPVPRRNITAMVEEELAALSGAGAVVTIRVPGGEEMAKKTTNARLGLVGGVSILGTTGIVKPYSTSAFRASVIQQIDVAKELGLPAVVFTTGGKTETYAMALHPELPDTSFVQVGDFIGAAVRHAAKREVARAIVVGMMGKMSKMADGNMMTHAAGSEVNMEYLAAVARQAGASHQVEERIRGANTARHVLEICQEVGVHQVPALVCRDLAGHLARFARDPIAIEAVLVGFDGVPLGKFPEDRSEETGDARAIAEPP